MDNNKDDDLRDDGKRLDKVVANLATESSKKRKDGVKMDDAGSNVAGSSKDAEMSDNVVANVEESSKGLLKEGWKLDNVWSNKEASSKWRKDLGISDTLWTFNVAGPSKGALKQAPGELLLSLDESQPQPIDPKFAFQWHDGKSIDDLANEILEMIGAYFPIDGLMNSVPVLNSKWNALQERIAINKQHLIVFAPKDYTLNQVFLKVYGKYSGLSLLKPVYSSVLSKNEDLLPDFSNDMTVLKLAQRKFPNIKSVSVLTFSFYDSNDKFAKLIGCWPNLVELKLIAYQFKNMSGNAEEWWITLADKINNTFKGLKHLTLFGRVVKNVVIDLNRLARLGQLESLFLGSFGVDLARLVAIRRLGLWHMKDNEWVEKLADMKKVVAERITELTIFPGIDQLALPYVNMIGNKFPSLEYLYIRTSLPLNQTLAPLAKLIKLKHLRIWNRQIAPLSYIDPTELESLQPLESVELLHLNIRLVTHSQLDWIPRLFPALKWIKLDWFLSNCEDCADRDKCGRIMLQPLKQCAELRRIYLDISLLKVEDCVPEHLTNSWEELAPKDLVVDSE